jgi:Xaa-Pro dipeptidase
MMIASPANDKSSTSSSSATTAAPYYSQGLTTYAVPMSLHATNRSRLLSSISTIIRPGSRAAAGLILLEGGKQQTRYDTDTEPIFRQESYFHYLFGASSYEGCFGIITLPPPTEKSKTILFVPTYDIEVATVCGPCPNFQSVKEELYVDEVRDVNELSSVIDKEMEYLIAHKDNNDNAKDREEADNTSIAKIYLLKGLNTDSGKYAQPAYYNGIEKYTNIIDDTTLFPCLVECRVIKSPAEIELMRYTNWVSSMAHVATMRTCQPNMMEYQLESTFLHYTYYYGGMRHMAYTCICGCGPNASILHYGHAGRPNSGRVLQSGDMALLDMGGEYHCYASDITCSYPVNGVYSANQKSIYDSVLSAQIAVIGRLKPGVSWVDMHHVAEREILQGLLKCGVLIIPTNSNNNDDDAGSNNDNDVILLEVTS